MSGDRPTGGHEEREDGGDWSEEDWADDGESWTAEDERRYQERRTAERRSVRRRRAQAGFFTVVVLLVLGAGTAAAGVYQGWWQWPPWSGSGSPDPVRTVVLCPTPEQNSLAAEEVTLAVLNSTNRSGLAGTTAEQLQARGFTVGSVGNDASGPVSGSAVVRHGPEGLLAARTVAAQIDGATLQDDGRAGTAVELAVGEAFTELRPPEVAAEVLRPEPAPSPAGCVSPQPAEPTDATPAPTGGTPAPDATPAPTG